MAAVGGDLETLQALYSRFTDAASQTESLRTSVDTAMQSAVWTGPNADAFRSAWEGFKTTLNQIQTALIDGSTDVKNQNNNLAAATGSSAYI